MWKAMLRGGEIFALGSPTLPPCNTQALCLPSLVSPPFLSEAASRLCRAFHLDVDGIHPYYTNSSLLQSGIKGIHFLKKVFK